MSKEKPNINDLIMETIMDLKRDRTQALRLLEQAEDSISSKNEHVTIGPIAVQYLGKAQKSADQMIKLIELLKKYQDDEAQNTMSDLSSLISENSDETKNKVKIADEHVSEFAKRKLEKVFTGEGSSSDEGELTGDHIRKFFDKIVEDYENENPDLDTEEGGEEEDE